ncbi:TetR/AcrR family transcriptional regulator [Pedobacter helvus]|uniref:TetR/AcrR family transcriptional regulator n=1 Tax=Pedobacter helvus TaxID=2563444 RepID=A0ABW9JKS6_9SPHI|nr:TetR/AcrR family transcriptional regulator [Pedobacter ureilyticus]
MDVQKEKDRMLASARNLVIRKGLRNFQLNDIVETLGISKKTIYVCFEDKAALVREMVVGNIYSLAQAIDNRGVRSASQEFDYVTGILLDSFMVWRSTSQHDLQSSYPSVFELYSSFTVDVVERFYEHNFQRGILEGEYISEWDVSLLVSHVMLMLENCQLIISRRLINFSGNEIKEYFIQHFLKGIKK